MATQSKSKGIFWTIIAFVVVISQIIAAIDSCDSASVSAAPSKSYTCPAVNITAKVETNATLAVTERRTFDFDGKFSAVWWELGDRLPSKAAVHIVGVSLARGEQESQFTTLPEAPFKSEWRYSGGSATPAWSFDEQRDTVYVFAPANNEIVTYELTYEIQNGVRAYKDVGELYWQFVGSSWSGDSKNVTLNVQLPVPNNAEASSPEGARAGEDTSPATLPSNNTVVAGETVYAWGHGALDGNVTIHDDGTITYTIARVTAGEFAEARVAFPSAWLTQVDPEVSAQTQYNKLSTIVSEEQAWADEANQQRFMSLLFVGVIVIACVVAIICAVLLLLIYGREHKAEFQEKYWRDVPDKAIPAASIGRLWRWNNQSPNDFTATIMQLAQKGFLRIDNNAKEDQSAHYYLTKLEVPTSNDMPEPNAPNAQALSSAEQAALTLLFDTISSNGTTLWLDEIKEYGKKNPVSYQNAMLKWQTTLDTQTSAYNFFETKSKAMAGGMTAAAIIFAILGVMAAFFTDNLIPVIFMVPTAVVLFIISRFMPRRSRYGNEVYARSAALKNWLQDFSKLDERPPTDIKVWGEFMIYAYIFGVAKEAIKQLRNTVPELFESPEYPSGDSSFVPWYIWYTSANDSSIFGGSVFGEASFADAFNTTMENTLQTANNAVAAASAAASGGSGGDSGFSSGGGFGGGFSGGGGGGFGGGGGAR